MSDIWIITNRHVLLGGPLSDEVPKHISWGFRRTSREGRSEWDERTISGPELAGCIRLHPSNDVDVAALRITDLFRDWLLSHKEADHEGTAEINFASVESPSLVLPSSAEWHAGKSVLIAGYPRGYHDQWNAFPIVKSGIIATGWGLHFNGQPCFLIDAKLFPGSSGSIVLSPPTYVETAEGVRQQPWKVAGIYSGEPKMPGPTIQAGDITLSVSDGFGLGMVWYASAIAEILTAGRSCR